MSDKPLAPCPFCGTPPILDVHYIEDAPFPRDDIRDVEFVVIRCASCGISKQKRYRSDAFDWWNKRVAATPSRPVSEGALLEAAKNALNWFDARGYIPARRNGEPIDADSTTVEIGPVMQKVIDDLRAALAAPPAAVGREDLLKRVQWALDQMRPNDDASMLEDRLKMYGVALSPQDGKVAVPAAWGRIIDGAAVTVSREWTRANNEPLYASQSALGAADRAVIAAACRLVAADTFVNPTMTREKAVNAATVELYEAVGKWHGAQPAAQALPRAERSPE